MSLLVLSAVDVDTLVSAFSPEDLQLLMARVFSRLSSSPSSGSEAGETNNRGIFMPPRLSIPTVDHTALFMPARIGPPSHGSYARGSNPHGDTAIKVVCVPRASDARGLPATTLVLDERTGAAKAVVNARKLTALRNAAGSLLSTSLVGPSNPQTLVAFGAGKQIEAHLDLHIRHFPSITHCTIVNRTINERTLSLKNTANTRFPRVAVQLLASQSNPADFLRKDGDGDKIEQAVRSADIIVCATSSTAPLFPSSWVKTGTHIILIGSYTPSMREVDRDLIIRSLGGSFPKAHVAEACLLVDSREACLHEAGELIDAQVRHDQMTEIGELIPTDEHGDIAMQSYYDLLARDRPLGDQGDFDGPVTIFKSVGVGIQDVAIASAIVEKASSLGEGKIGTIIPNYDA